MDKPIQAGDLAIITKPKSCCGGGALGWVILVKRIKGGPSHCKQCGFQNENTIDAQDEVGDWINVARLKRIPPPEELGIVDEKEELTA